MNLEFLIFEIERMFAAIPAIYCEVKANYTINIFHTDEESTLFTAWFFNLKYLILNFSAILFPSLDGKDSGRVTSCL